MNTMMKYAAYNEARRRDGRGRFTSEMENGMRGEGNDQMRAEAYGGMRMGGAESQRMENRYSVDEIHRRVEPGRDDPVKGNGTFRMAYDGGEARRMIGFGNTEGRYEGPYKGDEFEHRQSPKERGYSASTVYMPVDKHLAEKWVRRMKNADGTTGPHWTYEQAEKLMKQKGINCDPVIFWVCMNAEYSDRCEVYKDYGVGSIDFYADCVKAFWLEDEDAVEDKPAAYYACIVKH